MDQEFDSTGRRVRARNEKGEPICGKRKRNGDACQCQIGLNGDGLCTKHKNKPAFQKALLSKQEARFAAYFAACFNATRAARLAGFPQKNKRGQGFRLLKKPAVLAEIERLKLENAGRINMDTSFMLLQLERIISFDVRNLFDIAGNPLGPHELDDDTAAAISSVDTCGTARTGEVRKWKFEKKLAALQTALKIRGVLEPGGDVSALNDEELVEYERMQLKMSSRTQGDTG